MRHIYEEYNINISSRSKNKVNLISADIIDALKRNKIKPGVRLLSSTALGEKTGTCSNTILEVYHKLRREGWVGKMNQSGTFVATVFPIVDKNARSRLAEKMMLVNSDEKRIQPEKLNTSKFFTLGNVVNPPHWLNDASSKKNNLFQPLLWYSKEQWEMFSRTDKFMEAVQFNIAFKRGISIPTSQIAIVKDAATCLRLTFEILKKRGITTVIMRRTANAFIYSFLKDLGFKLVFVELGMDGFTVDLIKEVVEREKITLEGCVLYTAPTIEYVFDVSSIKERSEALVEYLFQNKALLVEYYYGDNKLGFLCADTRLYNNIISMNTYANAGLTLKDILAVVGPTDFVHQLDEQVRFKSEPPGLFEQHMAVNFTETGAIYESFSINEKYHEAMRVKVVALVEKHFKKRFKIVFNLGGNSLWLQEQDNAVFTVNWRECPTDLKASVELNIGHSAGPIPDKVMFSHLLIYLNSIDIDRLAEFFIWLKKEMYVSG